ncbi:MAG: nuclear transport factor 2 family protein [Candidatus Lokiarchaeia archaeon]
MSSNQTETEKESEKKVIEKAVMDYYHEGHVKSDPELYKNILHDEWKFFLFDENNQLWIVDKDEYLSWYNPEKVNKNLNWETKFYNIDVTGNIAAVKLKIECEEVSYIDYFNLMKINSKWWIVHKLSHKLDLND